MYSIDPFYIITKLWPGNHHPTFCHRFLNELEKRVCHCTCVQCRASFDIQYSIFNISSPWWFSFGLTSINLCRHSSHRTNSCATTHKTLTTWNTKLVSLGFFSVMAPLPLLRKFCVLYFVFCVLRFLNLINSRHWIQLCHLQENGTWGGASRIRHEQEDW
jgi:hypothetical protein